MEDLLKFVLTPLLDEPNKLEITNEKDGQTNLERFYIKVAEKDKGKVIGKGGKIIMSLRQLAKIKGVKDNRRYFLELVE